MSAPFGPRKFGLSLSRAVRRAGKRALRRGVEGQTTRIQAVEHAWRAEALEPRILMAADPMSIAVGGYSGQQVELRFQQGGGNRIVQVFVGNAQQGSDYDIDIAGNLIAVEGSETNDQIKLVFGADFDGSDIDLSVLGNGGVDSVQLEWGSAALTHLDMLTVSAEQITLGVEAGGTGSLFVTADVTIEAESSVTGGTASVALNQGITAGGSLIVSASAVHNTTSGAASTASVSVGGDLVAASVDIAATVTRTLTDSSLGLANYDFGDAIASLNVADGANITADDVNLAATVDGAVKMGPQADIPGNISAAVQSIKFVVITAKDVATIALGNGSIHADGAEGAANVAAAVSTEYASAGILVSQKIQGKATVAATDTNISAGSGGVSITADVAQNLKAVGPAFVAETTPPTFPMAVAAFAFNEERVVSKVTLTGVGIDTTGNSTVAARNSTSVSSILAGHAQSASESLSALSGLPQLAVAGMFATNEVLSDVEVSLKDSVIDAEGDA